MPLTQTTTNIMTLEKARGLIENLRGIIPFLSQADKETLEILLNFDTVNQLEQSLNDEKEGRLEPLAAIL